MYKCLNLPVDTVGINNSYNAAMLCIEILALKYGNLKNKLKLYRTSMKEKYIRENEDEGDL